MSDQTPRRYKSLRQFDMGAGCFWFSVFFVFVLLIMLFGGDPDLMDAIIEKVRQQ